MALVLADRVLETTPVAGTGDANLGGAVTGYQPFSTIGGGNTTYYTIVAIDDMGAPTGDWEVGIGTYVTTGNKLTRDTVLSSSNGGAKVYFASGTKQIFLDLPSEEVTNGNVVGPASAVANNFASFNMTTGKLIKDSGYNASSFATAAQGAKADTAVQPGSLGTAAYLNAGVANGVATLDSGGQVPLSQIPPLGDLNYQGAWNASSNMPTLVSSSGTKGYYYVVSVAGSTNLNGITDWNIGDWAVFNGSVWQKIDNTDSVTSVNGKTGTVVLTYSDVGAFPATSTTGSGNVVLQTGATLNNPTIGNYEAWTSTSAPSYVEGLQWYDSTAHSLAYYNDSANCIVHIGQDIQVKVINNTGSTIPNGSPVYITSTSSGQTYPNIALAKADVAATSAVIGLTNGAITNGSIGYVTSTGGIDNVNTGTFTVGQVLYLSPYSAGQLMNTIPPTGITVQVGVVSYVNSSTGKIYVKQTTPLAVPASIITGTLGVANGGTGATTLTGYVKGSGTSALTASSTIPTTDLSGTITNAQLANSSITINGTATSLGGSISVGTVTSVSGTAPIASTGGATPTISISQATTSTNGYLSSTDWNTFNNKQPAGTYVTAVTVVSANGFTGSSSGGATPALTLGTSITGLLKGNGTAISAATSGTDYAPATSGSSILYGNGSGGFSNVTVGSNLTFSAGTLSATSTMVYPGAGIPNSTGSAWGTSYTTTGSGTVVALATSPTFATSILGDFSNATVASRTLFKTSTTNSATGIYAVPNGTSTAASWQASNAADPTNASKILIATNGSTDVQLVSGINGTGTYLPMGFWNNGAEKARLSVSGGFSVGTTSDAGSTNILAAGTVTGAEVIASNGLIVNKNTVAASYSIPSGNNAMSVGPITVASGQSVTVPTGSRWVVL